MSTLEDSISLDSLLHEQRRKQEKDETETICELITKIKKRHSKMRIEM
jgi:hypothetical protein